MALFFNRLFADIRSLPRPVYILVLGQFLNRFGAFVFPFLTLFLEQRDYSLGKIAGVLAAISLGNFFGPMAGGYLADAIGRRNTIVLSLVSSAISLVSLYFCRNYNVLIIMSVVYGFSNFIFGPPTSALITDLVPKDKRVTAFAMLRLAINAGFAAGPMVAGLVFAYSPFLIFVGDAITTLSFALLAFLCLPHGLRTIEGPAASPRVILESWKAAFFDVRRNAPYSQFLLSCLLMGIAFSQVFGLLALTATEQGMPTAVYGVLMGSNGVLIILIEIPLTHWLNRFPAQRVLAIGYAGIGLGCIAFGYATSLLGFFLAMALFTMGEIIALPIGMAYSSNLAPEALRGRYFGFRGMTWALASLIGSAGVWLYGFMGDHWWHLSGLIGIFGALTILGGKKKGYFARRSQSHKERLLSAPIAPKSHKRE